jgi:single-stranded-DNA-specific exonuclease
VTDHHTLGERLPEALAVVNPKRKDCPAGMNVLAGVGVAFCLAIGLRSHLRDTGFFTDRREPNLKSLCDLVALGTIADMVPLLQENRIFSAVGLELISSGRRPGLAALLEIAGIANRRTEAEDVAFRLGPRLNAAGRVEDAALSVELLTSRRPDGARRMARTLDELNNRRRELEKAILEDIDTRIQRTPGLLEARTLVFAAPAWHVGVIGIVASKIMDRYHRPVALIALEQGGGRGSARSIAGVNLYDSLASCGGLLEDFGGHSQAAGFRITERNIPAFRETFEAAVRSRYPQETFVRNMEIDAEIDLEDISEDLLDQIERLMPFGPGNPEPILAARNVAVLASKWVGGNHRQMLLGQGDGGGGRGVRAIEFHADPSVSGPHGFERLAFRLRRNRWNGRASIQLQVEDAVLRNF